MSDNKTVDSILHEKLNDLEIPGAQIEFEPQEAEQLGAFLEEALNETEALESCIDRMEEAHD